MLQSYKAPTSVLTNRAGEFVAFGYEAEQRYSEALEDDDDDKDDLALFRHFKMRLVKTEVSSSVPNISCSRPVIIRPLDGRAHKNFSSKFLRASEQFVLFSHYCTPRGSLTCWKNEKCAVRIIRPNYRPLRTIFHVCDGVDIRNSR